jgi:uncharacterized protein YoxC/DNA-binding CsgD family transcriptional regulator
VSNLPDTLLVLVSILLATTIGAAIEYYRRLRMAKKEYEKAKGAIEEIILSFNRQLKHEAEKLEVVAYKVEAIASKSEGALNRSNDIGRKVNTLETRVLASSEGMETIHTRLDDVEKRVRDAVASQETASAKITSLEEQAKRILMAPEASFEPVIPIKREKALARLTPTEISVLEMLASEGAKTAPEIKERVKLSREHTARLMKQLYEEGYLERDTSKIPFKYSVKKEMEKLLKKTESQPT